MTSGGVTETYSYDAEGSRIRRTRGSTTTAFIEGGIWDEIAGGGATTTSSMFNGSVLAQRTTSGSTSTVVYLHGDQLGSVSATTTSAGGILNRQEYDPWGAIRSGDLPETVRDFTGQRRDDTGLLYYNARYYDPSIGRFISADSIVPGAGALTLAPHDAVAKGAWGKGGGGPGNPQELNRYSYGLNNPVRNTDPTGHCIDWIWGGANCQFTTDVTKMDWAGGANVIHTGLDVAGLLPGAGAVPDAINAAMYAAEGDFVNAGLSAAAAIPGAGDAAGLTKLTAKVCSFSAETPVQTEDGTEAIAALEPGDQVLAYHEGLDATGVYTVTNVWAHTDPVVVTLRIDGEVIETTPEHPFFVTARGWVPAGQLVAGSVIQQADGTTGVVQATQTEQRSQVMYNLTVAEAHTYFVGNGGWLVHNACGPRMRHYTSRSGSNGIEDTGIINASERQWESGCVFCESTNRSPLSPRDAESTYGLGKGKGRDYVEFDTAPGEARTVTNPRTGRTEWVVDGDVSLDRRNPQIVRRR